MLTCLSALYLILFVQYTASQVYHVKDFGAVGDGISDDTIAVRTALSTAALTNGGRVIFDAGYIFLTGCFNVTSNITLDVQGTIKGSINVKDYEYIPLLPWYGGTTVGGFSGNITLQKQALVFSYYANNITITGGGTIDGQGPLWYACLSQNNKNDTVAPCYPYGRPRLVQLTHSTNIVVDNIKLKDSPFWTLHLANTTNVHATNLYITTPIPGNYVPKGYGLNTDGVDIDCSVNVTIENSYISTADDAIAVKSGLDWFGRTYGRTSEDILVRDLTIGFSNGLAIGSEMSAGARNITFQDCTLNGSLRAILVKTARLRGGTIQDVKYSNIKIYNTTYAITISMYYTGYNVPPQNDSATPKIQNIILNNITGDHNDYAWYLKGLPESPIQNLYLGNIINTNTVMNEFDGCTNVTGICDSSSVFPSCPPCIIAEQCFDASSDCLQYMPACDLPAYRPLMCDECRKTCKLCNSC